MRLPILPALLSVLLAACALPSAKIVGGAAAGWLANIETAGKDADQLLATDAPLKHQLCDQTPDKSPRFSAWCAHIPVDVTGLALQWAAVAEAGKSDER